MLLGLAVGTFVLGVFILFCRAICLDGEEADRNREQRRRELMAKDPNRRGHLRIVK